MRIGKYLKFYHRCAKTGTVPGLNGLCQNFEKEKYFNKKFELFIPTKDEKEKLFAGAYWAEDDNPMFLGEFFGPTRQNIVLLMAAMNNEL